MEKYNKCLKKTTTPWIISTLSHVIILWCPCKQWKPCQWRRTPARNKKLLIIQPPISCNFSKESLKSDMKILMLKNGLLKKKNSCLSLGTNALTGINSPKSLWVNLLKFATGNTTNLCLKNKNGPKRMRSSSSICGKCKKNLGFRSRMPSKVQFFLI